MPQVSFAVPGRRALSRRNLWEALPGPARSTVGRAIAALPLPLILGGKFRRTLRFVRRAQWWSAEQMRQYQVGQIRRIAMLAYSRTAFYRRMFNDAGVDPASIRSGEDLRRLPTIDKETLREHLRDMCTGEWPPKSADYVSTGGTGGTPLRFYINGDRSATEYAHLVATWERAGFKLGTPMAVLRGQVVEARRNGMRYRYDPILRHHTYSNFHTSDEALSAYVAHMQTIGPFFLHAYPSSADVLVRYLKRSGDTLPNLLGIIAESEIVYDEQRKRAEETVGRRYFSCYGHSEKLVLAGECEQSSRYHVWPTYGYCELLDEAGRPIAAPGQRGEIVGTGFINTVMPFIRYRTGDHATYVGEGCDACDRRHMLLEDIRGHRTQEVLIARDGSEISWTALNMHDETFENVRQFQLRQERPGEAVLRIVASATFGERDRTRVLESLARKLRGQIEMSLELTDTIRLTERGKAVYVDQRINGLHKHSAAG